MKEVKITLSDGKRTIEISDKINEDYGLWQYKLNLIEPALRALTFSKDEELEEVMNTKFKG